MPQGLNPPLRDVPMDRDPMVMPLLINPPEWRATKRITVERVAEMNFGLDNWLSRAEKNLFLHLITLRENALAFSPEERGLLRREVGDPYQIPTVPHEPWQI